MNVAVIGASGFVGAAVCEALRSHGVDVRAVKAPRLSTSSEPELLAKAQELAAELADAGAVVNAAGVADATGDSDQLMLANGVLPQVVGIAAQTVGARFVHISSAAVQGNVDTLDSSEATHAFSPYSRSKAEGERRVLQLRRAGADAVIYRPPGVHHPSRSVTKQLARLAHSPLASVAGSGDAPTAQALLENVADAVAFLATCDAPVPEIVHHPSENLTTTSLLESLGGRRPRRVPQRVARTLVSALARADRIKPGMAGVSRRAEMLWFGQNQAPSWLQKAGWTPVLPTTHWADLGRELQKRKNS